jgi:hypothetical protein
MATLMQFQIHKFSCQSFKSEFAVLGRDGGSDNAISTLYRTWVLTNMFSKKFEFYRVEQQGWLLAAGVIALCGTVLRVIQYAADRSLWLDEAMLALNIVNRNVVQLLIGPLDLNQGAPPGYLMIEKLMVGVLGNSEYALRLFALVAGSLALLLMAVVAKASLKMAGALFALTLLAIGQYPIYYASEAKPYASDLMIALLLYVAASSPMRGKITYRQAIFLGGLGALALWFSYPAVFVLAGIGCTLLWQGVIQRRWETWRPLALCGALWLSSFALLYLFTLRNLTANHILLDYWQGRFMPLPPWREPGWLLRTLRQMMQNPAGLPMTLASVLFLIGLYGLFTNQWSWALALAAPLGFTLLASALHQYPFGNRLLMFALPNILLITVGGLEWIHTALQRPWLAYPVTVIVAGMLLWQPLVSAIENVGAPTMREHVRPLLAYLQVHRQPQDRTYVYYGALAAFQYYAPFYGFKTGDYIVGSDARGHSAVYLNELDALEGQRRVWLLFSHVYEAKGANEEVLILHHLDSVGRRMTKVDEPDATLYLYNLAVSNVGRQSVKLPAEPMIGSGKVHYESFHRYSMLQ